VVAAVYVVTISIVATWLWSPDSGDDRLAQEMTTAHIRSLMVDHLTDVNSTDQHTVRPWFDGHVDFAPPVIDLGAQDFALVGGRLDYVAERPVAVLVYKRRRHIINLFMFPNQSQPHQPDGSTVKQGYNLIHWDKAGIAFWAVSDMNMGELKEFSQLYQN
jgi:anti-sigma factor RsiW